MPDIDYVPAPPGDAWWPYCKRCGALVPPQALALHDAWHKDLDVTRGLASAF